MKKMHVTWHHLYSCFLFWHRDFFTFRQSIRISIQQGAIRHFKYVMIKFDPLDKEKDKVLRVETKESTCKCVVMSLNKSSIHIVTIKKLYS